jgi:hypothetical protein
MNALFERFTLASSVMETAQRWDVLISDPYTLKRRTQRLLVELRAKPRRRPRPNVYQLSNPVQMEELQELLDCMARVADGPDNDLVTFFHVASFRLA